jgi:hypothetical protein
VLREYGVGTVRQGPRSGDEIGRWSISTIVIGIESSPGWGMNGSVGIPDANLMHRTALTAREQDEVDLWDLVCHQFFIEVEANGYVPILGNCQARRGRFCASSDVEDVEFRLQALG